MLVKKVSQSPRSPGKQLKRSLPNNVKPTIVFTGTNLLSNFNVKGFVSFTEKDDVIYRSIYANESCNEDYVGERARRLYECVKDHKVRDHFSYIYKHAGETSHLPVDTANFDLVGSGYRNNVRGIKIAETILVKKLKPTLNIQKD